MKTCAQCGYALEPEDEGFCAGCLAGEPWAGRYFRWLIPPGDREKRVVKVVPAAGRGYTPGSGGYEGAWVYPFNGRKGGRGTK